MAKVMDKETIQFIMRSMTTNNRELQRRVAQQYLTEDVKLTHVLGDVRGRDAVYGVYRAAVTGLDYKLLFKEMVADEHMVAYWVDLNIKLAPLYIKRYHMPTIVMLRFRHCEDGLIRVCEQVDHHSVFVLMWALGWPFSTLWDLVFRRITGTLLSSSGWAIDTAEDAARAAFYAGLKSSGWLMGRLLPQPVLDTLTQALPGGLVQQLGIDSAAAAAAGMPDPAKCAADAADRVWNDVAAGVNAAAATALSRGPLLPFSSSSSSSKGMAAASGDAAAAAPASSSAPHAGSDGYIAAAVADGYNAEAVPAAPPASAMDAGAAGGSGVKAAAATAPAAGAAASALSGPGSKSGKRKKQR